MHLDDRDDVDDDVDDGDDDGGDRDDDDDVEDDDDGDDNDDQSAYQLPVALDRNKSLFWGQKEKKRKGLNFCSDHLTFSLSFPFIFCNSASLLMGFFFFKTNLFHCTDHRIFVNFFNGKKDLIDILKLWNVSKSL